MGINAAKRRYEFGGAMKSCYEAIAIDMSMADSTLKSYSFSPEDGILKISLELYDLYVVDFFSPTYWIFVIVGRSTFLTLS